MAIKARYNGLEIDGNLLPLFSGAFHYWQSQREDWPHIFDQVKALGFQVVETLVPWAVHEISAGDFDFGRVDGRKDLDAWLNLAHQKGMKVLLRPGPCMSDAIPGHGYPERLGAGAPWRRSFRSTCIRMGRWWPCRWGMRWTPS
jgi:beta-galactosidase